MFEKYRQDNVIIKYKFSVIILFGMFFTSVLFLNHSSYYNFVYNLLMPINTIAIIAGLFMWNFEDEFNFNPTITQPLVLSGFIGLIILGGGFGSTFFYLLSLILLSTLLILFNTHEKNS